MECGGMRGRQSMCGRQRMRDRRQGMDRRRRNMRVADIGVSVVGDAVIDMRKPPDGAAVSMESRSGEMRCVTGKVWREMRSRVHGEVRHAAWMSATKMRPTAAEMSATAAWMTTAAAWMAAAARMASTTASCGQCGPGRRRYQETQSSNACGQL
jgi:hypothetical protein